MSCYLTVQVINITRSSLFKNRSPNYLAVSVNCIWHGGAIYAKYRFYSQDAVYRHFRMAAFGRISYDNAPVHQDEVETNGQNSGFEIGWIGTQLLHRQAISASVSYEHTPFGDQISTSEIFGSSKAINHSLSTGRLILPRSYKVLLPDKFQHHGGIARPVFTRKWEELS